MLFILQRRGAWAGFLCARTLGIRYTRMKFYAMYGTSCFKISIQPLLTATSYSWSMIEYRRSWCVCICRGCFVGYNGVVHGVRIPPLAYKVNVVYHSRHSGLNSIQNSPRNTSLAPILCLYLLQTGSLLNISQQATYVWHTSCWSGWGGTWPSRRRRWRR